MTEVSTAKIEALRVVEHDPRFRSLVGSAPTGEILGDHFIFTEGPVWDPRRRHLLFTDIPASRIHCWSPAQGFSLFRDGSNKANGLALDRDGALLICEHATSRVVRLDEGGAIEILAAHFEGRALNSPNDIVIGPSGDIYFTDPIYGRTADPWGVQRPEEMGFRGVYRLARNTGALDAIARDFDGPNGLCFSRDARLLYVNDSERQHIRIFAIGADGSVRGGEVWAETKGSEEGCPDGMKVDAAGNVWCCGPGGIHVFDGNAVCLGAIFLPPVVTNFAFGGDDLRDLFVTASNRVYRLRLGVPGLPIF